jgi:hypothetical protein
MRITTFFGILLTSLLLSVLGLVYWPTFIELMTATNRSKTQEELKDLENVEALINLGRAEEALNLIEKYQELILLGNAPSSEKWLKALIKASELSLSIPQLLSLHEFNPEMIEQFEKASLLVADAHITTGKVNEYETLRKNWQGKENYSNAWLTLDADHLLLQGKKEDAIKLLQSQSFNNETDVERLIRLAILTMNDDPKLAWEFLSEAYTKSPTNPFVRSYRAHLFELENKLPLAEAEYSAALEKTPQDLFLRDQLAEFYLRNNETEKAVQTWQEGLGLQAKDALWIKTIFWSKVLHPKQVDWKTLSSSEEPLSPFTKYLLALPNDQFWNSISFENLSNTSTILETEQAAFWLRLLNALKQNQEEQAWELLQNNSFANHSWNPELETTLKRILNYRKTKTLVLEGESLKTPHQKPAHSSLFIKLELLATEERLKQASTKIPESIHALLSSKEAFAAALLDAGWQEAALRLHTMQLVPENFPDWFTVKLTEALRTNRSIKEALQFASLQEPTQPLSVLIGELFLEEGKAEAGIKELTPLATAKSDEGFKAASLLSLYYLNQKRYPEARHVIQKQPLLLQSVKGKELLARIALLEGNKEEATQLYTSIERNSNEAKSYLARKAFAEKNWQKAQQLTEDLLQMYPTNQLLRDNLTKVIAEQQKK